MNTLNDITLANQTVLIRVDFNVPRNDDGQVANDQRIRAALPTIKQCLDAGAKVRLMSHLGRPSEGVFDPDLSLAPVAKHLGHLLGCDVPLVRDYLNNEALPDAPLIMLENCRMNAGEKADDDALAKQYASLCDVFVMDAFGTAHRAQASTHGVIKHVPIACAGPLLAGELSALGKALTAPERPTYAVVGGAKVSSKLALLENLVEQVDGLIVGGGIANTFLAAQGLAMGSSLHEADLIDTAKRIMTRAQERGVHMPLPTDVVIADAFAADANTQTVAADAVSEGWMILDIGKDTAHTYAQALAQAKTVLWNGPVGVFEFDAFAAGTRALSEAIAESSAFSIAGGGDTLAAIDAFQLADQISYISTGGGAFLEFCEGKILPAVAALNARI